MTQSNFSFPNKKDYFFSKNKRSNFYLDSFSFSLYKRQAFLNESAISSGNEKNLMLNSFTFTNHSSLFLESFFFNFFSTIFQAKKRTQVIFIKKLLKITLISFLVIKELLFSILRIKEKLFPVLMLTENILFLLLIMLLLFQVGQCLL